METAEQVPARSPSRWICWIVSSLLVLHFFAKFTTVLNSGSLIVDRMNKPFRPYLGVLFLENGYRFFAPAPGPSPVLWFRVQYEDGSVLWDEWPKREDFATSMAYKRMLSMAGLVIETEPDPNNPDRTILRDDSAICLASYARHLSQDLQARRNSPVARIEIYQVQHFYLMPGAIRDGWDFSDPRLYEPQFFGVFRPDGTRYEASPVVDVQLPLLMADIIESDVKPQLTGDTARGDLQMQLRRLGIPDVVQTVLSQHPNLLSRSGADLVEEIHRVINTTKNVARNSRTQQELQVSR